MADLLGRQDPAWAPIDLASGLFMSWWLAFTGITLMSPKPEVRPGPPSDCFLEHFQLSAGSLTNSLCQCTLVIGGVWNCSLAQSHCSLFCLAGSGTDDTYLCHNHCYQQYSCCCSEADCVCVGRPIYAYMCGGHCL